MSDFSLAALSLSKKESPSHKQCNINEGDSSLDRLCEKEKSEDAFNYLKNYKNGHHDELACLPLVNLSDSGWILHLAVFKRLRP